MQRKKILTLVIVFFATLPISYIITAYAYFGVAIFMPILTGLGVNWSTAAHIAYISSTILTSLLFAFVVWLFVKSSNNQKNLILILVFFVTLPVSLFLTLLNPVANLIADILGAGTSAYEVSTSWVLVILLVVSTSLFFTLIAWLFLRFKMNSKVQRK